MPKNPRRPPLRVDQPYTKEFYHQQGSIPGTIIVDENASSPIILLIDYNQTDVIQSNWLDCYGNNCSWVTILILATRMARKFFDN